MKIMLSCRAGVLLGVVILSGCSGFNRQTPVKTLHYQCGTLPLTVTLRQDIQPAEVHFLLDGERLQLPQVVAASGTKYSNNRYTFWSKGDSAFIERSGHIIADDCLLQHAP
ncbi:MliC family protein [Candidatus Symbiopectobacterium sp. NZEC135]|uniref:MliC family protein n=1 Tax=Candidatus Symbiopectobacterium sp. NZEC135 TaxID=2820471 RepID=UPI0022265E27|nr:MliC family protein [Candidatus Symbiopectobacterium sp. NZEC135]MCW2478682.1 MliC family protein [Candidatus Symbiopectobacterium sp. NZEC135]